MTQDLYLITGFLGAGKTTFLNRTAKMFPGKRIAVIVNEFGKQGVDGALLSNQGYAVTEISNGSVFCVCRMDMFIEALIQAAKSPAELLLVETSGLSNPTNIDDILLQTAAAAGVSFDYRGCICLVDAVNFEKVYATAVVVPDQIRQASLVVVNKTDLAGEERVQEIEEIVRALNPGCEICRTVYADIPESLLRSLRPKRDRVLGGKQDLLTGSLTFRVLNRPNLDGFRALLDGIKSLVYRCKGYVSLAEGEFFVDGVMDEISLSRVETGHEPGVVLLYKTSGHVKKAVTRLAAEDGIEIELE